jgi:F-type H+-transporting ATPase subunit alpha
MDDLAVNEIGRFEKEFRQFLTVEGAAFYKQLAETKTLSEELTDQLVHLIKTFKKRFKPSVEEQQVAVSK